MYQLVLILHTALNIYRWALIIYIFMSWVPNARESSVGRFLERICEPYLQPFRRIIPPIGMIDISPWVAFIVLYLAQVGVLGLPRLLSNF